MDRFMDVLKASYRDAGQLRGQSKKNGEMQTQSPKAMQKLAGPIAMQPPLFQHVLQVLEKEAAVPPAPKRPAMTSAQHIGFH